jgi:type I restriction enzyme, S subunit
MSEWNTKPLGEIAENISRPFSFKERGKVIFINTGDVLEGKFLHADYSDVAGLPGQAKKAIKKGDILYSEIRPGNKRYVHVDFDADEYVVSTKFMVIRPTANVSSDFLYMLLTSKACEEEFKIIADSRSGTFPQITFDSVAYYPIRYPSIENQERLVEISNSLLNKIELNRQTNQTLEHIAQAIFKCWFVDFEPTRAKIIVKQKGGNELAQELAAQALICGAITLHKLAELEGGVLGIEKELHTLITKRFPNEGGVDDWQPQQLAAIAALFPNSLVDSELGEVPEGWEVIALDEIAHYQNGLALQKFRPEDEGDFLPVLKIAQLKKGFADGAEKASPNIKPECIVDNGDVVFSWSGSLVVDVWCGGKVALNQHLFKVTSLDYPKWFYCYWTKHHLEVFQQVAADKAVTMGHIKRSHLGEAKCIVPSCDLEQFSLMANLLEKQIDQRLESVSLQEVRDSLLPKFLSGELTTTTTEKANHV